MTQGYLIEAIGYLLSRIEARWPDRVTRDGPDLVFPGTFVKVRDDHTIWVGDHFDWDMWTVAELKRIADSLKSAMTEMEAA